jgi:UrcA family protein
MPSLGRHLPVSLLGVVCAMGFAAAPPAFGEDVAGNFTVLGHATTPYEHGLTAAVSYRDLDLTTRAGRAALRERVWKTAEKLCARMGEGRVNSATRALSCEDQAVYCASDQLQNAFARARLVAAREPRPTATSVGSDRAPAGGNYSLTVSMR